MTWITEEELEREIINKGDEFRRKKKSTNFIAAMGKWGMLGATKEKMSASEKKKNSEQKQIRHFVHKTCN